MPRSYGVTNAAPYASAPAVGAAGDTYYNTTDKNLYLSDGTSWNQIQGGGGTSASYAYLGITGAALTNGAWNLLQLGTPSPPGTFLNNFTQANSNRNLVCTQAGPYRAQVEASVTGTGVSSWVQLRIGHYNSGAVLQASHDLVGSGVPTANYFTGPSHEAMFNMAVGDYLQFFCMPNSTGVSVDARSSVMVVPVGGVKGDPGPQGPDVTLVQSAYGHYNATGTAALGNDVQTLVSWTLNRANNFSLVNSSQRITPALAGKYKISGTLGYQSPTNAAPYTRAIVNWRNSAGTVIVQWSNIGTAIAANGYGQAVFECVADMAVGDYIEILAAIANTTGFLLANSWVSVVPVGGTKGDPGATGASGGPVPTGGVLYQSIVKTGSADFAVGWNNQLGPGITGAVDFNSLTTMGVYSIGGNATHGPGPSTGGMVTVLPYAADPTFTIQTWQMADNAQPAQTWQRQGRSGTWTSWVRMGAGLQISALYDFNPGSLSGGGADYTAFTFVAVSNGWCEVTTGVMYFGFGGTNIVTAMMIYTNNYTGPDGGAWQTPVPSSPTATGGAWAKMIGPGPMIFPVTAGNTYVITLRANYSPNTTNCYFRVPMTLKVFAN